MKHTVYAVLTDEELVRTAEMAEAGGRASDLEIELLFRLRNRLDADYSAAEQGGEHGPHT